MIEVNPAKKKELIVFAAKKGFKPAKIAKVLGIPPSTVSGVLCDARKVDPAIPNFSRVRDGEKQPKAKTVRVDRELFDALKAEAKSRGYSNPATLIRAVLEAVCERDLLDIILGEERTREFRIANGLAFEDVDKAVSEGFEAATKLKDRSKELYRDNYNSTGISPLDYVKCAEAGMSMKEASEYLGVAYNTVRYQAQVHNIKFRRVS
jgi:hypothetical protein